MRRILLTAMCIAMATGAGCFRTQTRVSSQEKHPVRAAVSGGMAQTGLWDHIAKMFEDDSGYTVKLVATGDASLASVFAEGKADLVTLHSSDAATGAVAQGYAVNMRPWVYNEQVIAGPVSDPAGIRGMKDGAAALRRIAQTKSNFVDSRHMSSRTVCRTLWEKANITPNGPWLLKDESTKDLDVLFFAESRNAYVLAGRKKMLLKKVPPGMEILVQGDPAMRRPYVILEADPEVFPSANHAGARALSDFLLSDKVQKFVAAYGASEHDGIPFFHPLQSWQGDRK